MNGYSKMKIIGTPTKSRSMDFSDLLSSSSSSSSFHLTAKPISDTTTPNPAATRIQETDYQIKKNPTKTTTPQDSFSEQEEYPDDYNQECNDGDVKQLTRTSSVSSASAVVQSAVRKAFSMRRTSSVSERYCRIHDQSVTLASPFNDYYEDGFGMEATRSVKKKHSRSKILKACKRLLGL